MGKQFVDAGGAIVEILETKNFFAAPTKNDLDAWVNTYKIPVTSVIDAPGKDLATFKALGQREATYVVDLRTMKILFKYAGTQSGIGTTGAVSGMQKVLELLAMP